MVIIINGGLLGVPGCHGIVLLQNVDKLHNSIKKFELSGQ